MRRIWALNHVRRRLNERDWVVGLGLVGRQPTALIADKVMSTAARYLSDLSKFSKFSKSTVFAVHSLAFAQSARSNAAEQTIPPDVPDTRSLNHNHSLLQSLVVYCI
jgi:hypothetical protein